MKKFRVSVKFREKDPPDGKLPAEWIEAAYTVEANSFAQADREGQSHVVIRFGRVETLETTIELLDPPKRLT